MNDGPIHDSIEKMVDEEHALWDASEHGGLNDAQRSRLQELQINLDRCWDLLRQRQALIQSDGPAALQRDG